MRYDSYSYGDDIEGSIASAREADARGFDGWFTGQTSHDPFLLSARASERTESVLIGTAVVVALSRSPMDVAYSANDLQLLSGGRFVLGLGTQVRAHIERRFGAEWSAPRARIQEFVSAVRATWRAWNEDARLDFRGDFYEHTLMPPIFSPGSNPYGAPPIFLAAVGPALTEAAGCVADGLLCHGFTTERYLREHTMPALERGLTQAGRSRRDVEVSLPLFAVAEASEQERAAAEARIREQLGFYGSTPAYRGVLEAHGWGELHRELHALSRRGRWPEMARCIDADVFEAFTVRGAPGEIAHAIRDRFGGLVDRISFYQEPSFSDEEWDDFLETLRAGDPKV